MKDLDESLNFVRKLASSPELTPEQLKEAKKRIENRKKKILSSESNKQVIKNLVSKRTLDLCLFGEFENAAKAVPLERYKLPEQSKKYLDIAAIYEEFYEKVQEYEDQIINGTAQNYVFTGRAGTGKSYLALSLMKSLINKNKTVLFLNTVALKNCLFSSFKDEEARDKIEKIKLFSSRCDLLILDDLGAESNSESDDPKRASVSIQNTIYDIANHRVGRPLLTTTNSNLATLKLVYDERIISRLFPKNKENIRNFNQLKDLRNWSEY